MQELIAQLMRLYLPAGQAVPEGLPAHLAGRATSAFDVTVDGATRAIVIAFDKQADERARDHWQRLCDVANALQHELGLPAPAVSVSGASGFRLWLSLAEPIPLAAATHFVELLRAAYFADASAPMLTIGAPVELPPCVHTPSGKWAAFIHPGMGASFADEPALDMMPPAQAQAAFLEGLHSISAPQLQHALNLLEGARADAAPPPVRPAQGGLLLKDASLEDIVRHLHAMNIEPTFRHVLPR